MKLLTCKMTLDAQRKCFSYILFVTEGFILISVYLLNQGSVIPSFFQIVCRSEVPKSLLDTFALLCLETAQQ